ncbi:electron transport complex subunit RsxG [Cobetia amphilecti]|uniref:electron transport complex subunit RsxG n=1 Tax=Cobetia amphilecti TaxID=1055104 RepID=UPI00254A4F8F|nr:electron transport complex subunit RsxG [Cobetia amphilecti]
MSLTPDQPEQQAQAAQGLKHTIARAALGLAVFAVVTAGVVAVTQMTTAETIADNERAAQSAALAEIIPPSLHDNDLLDAAFALPPSQVLGLESADTGWRATRNGETVAVLLPVVTGKGYSGDIRLLVGIRADGSVAGVRAVKHAETPGLGDKIEARKSDWIHEFDDQTLSSVEWKVNKDGGDFDQFTGATITPRAVVGAVQQALIYFMAHRTALLAGDSETLTASRRAAQAQQSTQAPGADGMQTPPHSSEHGGDEPHE